jgi:hypothetical protein
MWQPDLGRKPLVFSAGPVLQGTAESSATEVIECLRFDDLPREHLILERIADRGRASRLAP